jgi:hypothetical protein
MATLVLTWQEVSNWLDLPQEHADEMFLMRRAEAIESHVNKFLAGYRIGQVSRTDQTVDGTGTKTLASPEAPLTALTAIKLGYDKTDPDDTLDPTDVNYIVFTPAGRITRTDGGTFPRKEQCVHLTYTAGWTEDTIPPEVTDAVSVWIAYMYRSRGAEASKSETHAGVYTHTRAAMKEAPGVIDMLMPYKRPVARTWL